MCEYPFVDSFTGSSIEFSLKRNTQESYSRVETNNAAISRTNTRRASEITPPPKELLPIKAQRSHRDDPYGRLEETVPQKQETKNKKNKIQTKTLSACIPTLWAVGLTQKRKHTSKLARNETKGIQTKYVCPHRGRKPIACDGRDRPTQTHGTALKKERKENQS